MPNTNIEDLKQKATFLNQLSNDEEALFDYINTNQDNLDEVIQQYKPEQEFKPVNTLRYLIANELKKGTVINKTIIEQLKQALENRDVSLYYNLNETVKQSLVNYKDSKVGMFPNWKHTFKILFPFLHNASENNEVKTLLNQLADEIIEVNQLENVTKHIVSFQGSQNYGSDRVWVAIIPDSAPSVQYAYQIFFTLDLNGLFGGIHKGHHLLKQDFNNQDDNYPTWEGYLDQTKLIKQQWFQLNSDVNFIFINDEKDFIKAIKKIEVSSLTDYFKTLDRLKEDLEIQDEEKLVFSLAKNRLSFQVGKRYCLNVNKNLFDFISNSDIEEDNINRESFSGDGSAYLYKGRNIGVVLNNYEDIKSAVENEIQRDNHAFAKFYDNSAFRKAVFDQEYRDKILSQNGMENKYYLVGAYWDDNDPMDQTERFIKDGIWVNGYQDKFIDIVKKVQVGSFIAIKTVDKKGNILFIKARGRVTENLNDGQNLKVSWDENFNEFKVGFSGGYWDTIKEVKKKNHIDAIWNNKEKSMRNVKKEFVDWFFKLPTRKYTALNREDLIAELDKSNSFFDRDIFTVSYSNYIELIEYLKHQINIKGSDFYQYSSKIFNHRPRAILSNNNYIKFLREKFNAPLNIMYYKAPLNQIFYGPPGTGKTYNTILEAAKIITQDETITYTDSQITFNELLGKQIEFITFHQNYSYEDFIQGLRPDTESNGELSFFKSDGVFKKIADRALKNFKESNTEVQKKKSFTEVFEDFVFPLIEGDVDEIEIKMKKVSFYITNIKDKSIEFRKMSGGTDHTLSIGTLREMYEEESTKNIQGLSSYYRPLLTELLKIGKLEETERIIKKNYVIIIDEINRANISRVFGELITLIEKDKRYGGNIPLTATLPSGEPFIVPSNLYIIGTMNTADKSIALLDIALRRRFEFKAMYPKYEIPDKTIHKPEFLKKLNELIVESGKGNDFTIGHSYFMCEENETFDFDSTINNKVIPLMLEYYMNSEKDVKKILDVALNEQKLKVGDWPLKVIPND